MTEQKTTLEDRRAALEPLIVRAWSDAAFRARLAERPREAFEEATGLRVPEGVELQVHLGTATHADIEVLNAEQPGFPWERVGPGWTLPQQALDDPSSFRGGYRQGCHLADLVVRRAWSDREWLEQLARDPHDALGGVIQLSIPSEATFSLVVDGPKVRHVAVPFRRDADGEYDGELSALELEMVAGGGGCAGPTIYTPNLSAT